MSDTSVLLARAEAEQAEFVALARELKPEQWAARSWCDEWTVREAVTHTAIHTHQTLRESVKAGKKMVQWRDEPTEMLVDCLASPLYAKSAWELRLQLSELMIHQQDVRRPLGLPREIAPDRLVAVLDSALARRDGLILGVRARKRSAGLRLVATDLDWSHSAGPEVRGPGEAILMAISGRTGTIDDLSGDGVAKLAARTTSA